MMARHLTASTRESDRSLRVYLKKLRQDPHCFRAFVEGPLFAVISSTGILGNTIYIGWETNQNMRNEMGRLTEDMDDTINPAGEYAFVVFFVLELCMRVLAQRWQWLIGRDRYWNIFDAVLILLTSFQLVFDTGSNLSVFRVFRVFRLVRLLKVVRRISCLESLKLMLFGIINCISPLFWAIMLLLLIMYAFGVFFHVMRGVSSQRNDTGARHGYRSLV